MSNDNRKVIIIVDENAETAAYISGVLTRCGYKTIITLPEIQTCLSDSRERISLALINFFPASRGTAAAELTSNIISEGIPVVSIADNSAESAAVHLPVQLYGIIAGVSGAHIITSAVEIALSLYQQDTVPGWTSGDYREIFNSSSDAIFVHDGATGRIADVNDTMLKMYGYATKDEVLGLRVSDLSAADEGYTEEKALQLMHDALESGTNRFEWKARKSDGQVFWSEVILHSTMIGNAGKIIASVRDITRRKMVEEELKKSEEWLLKERQFTRLLLDTTPAFIVAVDLSGKILMMNRAFLDFTGYSMDELAGTDYLAHIVPAEDREQLSGVFRQLKENRNATVNENRIMSRGGQIRLVEWHGEFVNAADAESSFFVGVGIDVTERKRAEDEIRASNEELTAMYEEMEAANEELIAVNYELQTAEERYRGVVETQSEMIARFREDGTITFVNRGWRNYYAEHLGLTGEVTGRKIQDIMQIKNYDQVLSYLYTLNPGQLSGSMERSVVSTSGKTRWQLWYIQKIADEKKTLSSTRLWEMTLLSEKQQKLRFVKARRSSGRLLSLLRMQYFWAALKALLSGQTGVPRNFQVIHIMNLWGTASICFLPGKRVTGSRCGMTCSGPGMSSAVKGFSRKRMDPPYS